MKTKILCFCLLMIVSGCVFNSPSCKHLKKPLNVKEFLSSLPKDELILLDYFFRGLIQQDSLGYVVLGEKPMGFYSYLKVKPVIDSYQIPDMLDKLDLFFAGFEQENALFHKGWEIWRKYEKNFCGNNIFFDAFELDKELHFRKVIVLNKRLLLPLLGRFLSEFQRLDPSIQTNESAFHALLCNDKFKKKFHTRHDLIGLCLGYGERNASLFQKMVQLREEIGEFGSTIKNHSPEQILMLKNELKLLEKTFKTATGKRICKSRKFSFSLGLGFRADLTDPETHLLIDKYKQCHKALIHAYQNANFLEKTLELIYLADKLDLREQ